MSQSIPERLALNLYETDEEESHIEVHQEEMKASGMAQTIIDACPAHVYSWAEDGTIGVEAAACLECGTCLALAKPGTLSWHYPRGGFGIQYQEG